MGYFDYNNDKRDWSNLIGVPLTVDGRFRGKIVRIDDANDGYDSIAYAITDQDYKVACRRLNLVED